MVIAIRTLFRRRLAAAAAAAALAAPAAHAQIPPLGDVDCNQVVDGRDARRVVAVVFGAADGCGRADVNGDAAVSIADSAAVARLLAAQPTPPPTATPTETASPSPSPSPSPSASLTPSPTPTDSPTPMPTRTPTPSTTPTGTLPPSATPTQSGTPTPSATPSATPTETRSSTPTPTDTVTRTPTVTPTSPPTATPSRTPTVTATATNTRTVTATASPTNSGTPTRTPTATRSFTPTLTLTPTRTVTQTRTPSPSQTPTFTRTSTATPTITRTPTQTRTPTNTPTITGTPTRTATPTATSTLAPGPNITWFGLASASGVPLAPVGTTAEGLEIFQHPANTGAGFLVVVEARPGLGGAPIGRCNQGYNEFDPGTRPHIQILASQALGAGSPLVCDAFKQAAPTGTACGGTPPSFPPPIGDFSEGGIPAIEPPDFDPASQTVADALNDFGCRLTFNTVDSPCTVTAFGNPRVVDPGSQGQFCSESVWSPFDRFHRGDTVLTARWRDTAGVLGPPKQIVVRVP